MITHQSQLSYQEMENILPYRKPWLLADRVRLGNTNEVIVEWQLPKNHIFFLGHCPGDPYCPTSILVQALFQASLLLYSYSYPLNDIFTLSQNKSYFSHKVRPGEKLDIIVRKMKFLPYSGLTTGEIFINQKKIVTSEITFISEPLESIQGS